MRFLFAFLMVLCLFFSCSDKKQHQIDISNIKDICIDVDSLGISSYPDEKEIILPGGLHFNIDNMDDTIHTSPNGKTYRKIFLQVLSNVDQIIINKWGHYCSNSPLLYSIPDDVNALFPKIGDNTSTSMITWRRLCSSNDIGAKSRLKKKKTKKKKRKIKR